jgi:hypothetical protein
MSRVAKALAARWRAQPLSLNADNWPGVLSRGPNWRVVLNRTAGRYVVQQRQSASARPWVPLLVPRQRPELVKALQGAFPGLPEALRGLPRDPAEAAAALAATQGVWVPQVQRRSYWLADDYPGVLSRDQNLRVVRDQTGTVYAVQWQPVRAEHGPNRGDWITQAKGEAWPPLAEYLNARAFEVKGEVGGDAIAARVARLFEGLPEFAADGPWPVVKALPAARPASRSAGTGRLLSPVTNKLPVGNSRRCKRIPVR